ncbi:MAG TPA: hypothetical protein VNH22_19750 [Blastocatellia bacterium]|jgi:filamentous hemagglutinin|nr:hypothetical protein [Blastocatellia bacterium]
MIKGSRSIHPNALPNYQNAIIPREKLEGYVLNSSHAVGKNKAIVFESALGLNQSDWEMLSRAILDELAYHEAVLGRNDAHGQRYNVTLPMNGPNGKTAHVLTAWIIKPGTNYPSFVTAMVQ